MGILSYIFQFVVFDFIIYIRQLISLSRMEIEFIRNPTIFWRKPYWIENCIDFFYSSRESAPRPSWQHHEIVSRNRSTISVLCNLYRQRHNASCMRAIQHTGMPTASLRLCMHCMLIPNTFHIIIRVSSSKYWQHATLALLATWF